MKAVLFATLIALAIAAPPTCASKSKSVTDRMRNKTMCGAAVDCLYNGMVAENCATAPEVYIVDHSCRCVRDSCPVESDPVVKPDRKLVRARDC